MSDSDIPLSQLKEKLNVSKPNDGPKPKMEFKMVRHGIKRKYRRECNFKCTICDFAIDSQGKLNVRHLQTHGTIKCAVCSKECATVSGYRMHLYEHSDKANRKTCDDCDKSFTFASQLKSHYKVHLTALEHQCQTCFKHFKNKGKLEKHVVSHSGKVWTCRDCKYTCSDPRNLKAHSFRHEERLRYSCTICNKGFKYYEQMKRHQKEHNQQG